MKKKKLLIFIVAYNAEKTIENTLNRIPKKLSKIYDIEILIIDDFSDDKTFEISKKIKKNKKLGLKLNILYNHQNQGYGGNQKIGYHYAIKKNFDYVVLLHGDGQYAPEKLPNLLNELKKKKYDVVMGSRMIKKKNAIKGGMPIYKFIGNIILTKIQNFLLGTKLSEFHSGYRVYNVKSLKKIPFLLNSNSYNFDTEIIIQLKLVDFKIKEVAIPTFYGQEISYLNGIDYACNILINTFIGSLHRFGFKFQKKFNLKKN